MQFLCLVRELRSQIHTVGQLSRCATAREARVLQWTPSAVKIKPTSQTKTCKLLDGLMHQGEVNKVEKRMRPKGAADNFHHFARGGLSDEGDIWMEMRKWGRRVFQGMAFWAVGTACAKALGGNMLGVFNEQLRNQCDNSWVCAGKSGRFETGWEGRWGGSHMPYRPYGEHFAFPLSEVGARGGVLAGSGCHKKNTTDWVAQTTGIYFSQSGGCKVQDQGVSRYFSQ